MSLLVIRVSCVYLFCCFLLPPAAAQKGVIFNIDNQYYNCNSSKDTVYLEKYESLTITVSSNEPVNEVNCTTASSELALTTDDYDKPSTKFTRNLSDKHNGTFTCMFLIRKDKDRNANFIWNGHNYTKVICEVNIKASGSSRRQDDDSSKSDLILGMDPTTFYIMIGCVVGALVVIIIIIQTAVIIYYKSRARRSEPSHLEQRPAPRDDTARYSSMPLRKCSRSKRQSSGIYQSLENLRAEAKPPPNIRDRPPMPLPVFNESDDDEMVYGGGKTLDRMFSPQPPPVETLPRRKKQKPKPKPAVKPKPMPEPHDNYDDMEEYDYADSDSHSTMNRKLIMKPMPIQPKPIRSGSPQTACSRPMPPVQCVNTLSELDSVLKRRQLTTRAQETVNPEAGIPSASQHYLPRRPIPPKESFPGPGLRGPQERDVRQPNAWTPPMKPALEPKPTQSTPWSQVPLVSRCPQEEVRASENSRIQDIRPQNVRFADHFEDRLQKPEPRPLVKRPDLVRAPQTAMVLPMHIMMKSPPLPRKPGQDEKPSVPGRRKLLPPPPESESVYEPVAAGGSSDDEEWEMEPLKPYNIYNI